MSSALVIPNIHQVYMHSVGQGTFSHLVGVFIEQQLELTCHIHILRSLNRCVTDQSNIDI